jgi:hypothetical protein
MKFTSISDLELLYSAYSSILTKWVKETDHKADLIENGLSTEIADARIKKLDQQLAELHAEILKLENEPQHVEFAGKVYEVYERKERTTILMGGDGFTIELPNDYFNTLPTLTKADISRA